MRIGSNPTAKEEEIRKIMARKPCRMVVLFAIVVATALVLSAGSVPAVGPLMDINTADRKALESLPGVGPAKAQAIIDGRPYRETDDVMKVKGIKQGIYNKIKDKITVQ